MTSEENKKSKGTQHSETPSPALLGTCAAACRAPLVVAVLREDKLQGSAE